MNNDRRKQIEGLKERLLNIRNDIDDVHSDLNSLRDEEQDAFDNMPESLQNSDRGQAAQEALDNLDSATSEVDDVLGLLQQVNDYLDSAAQ